MNMKKLLLIMCGILCSTIVWCADGDTFTANTVEGVEMTFKVTNEANKECQVGIGLGFSVVPSISKETKGAITIPSFVNGYKVTMLAVNAFADCSGITNINIPNTVTYIGSNALEGTQWYNDQPDGLVYISNILYKWKGMMTTPTTVVINDGTIAISESAFRRCSNLKSVTIPSGIINIGDFAFDSCNGLNEITIPEGVITIGQESFYGCTGLKELVIPNSVQKIGISAFSGCTNIANVTVPETVSSVGQNAFKNTKWLNNQQGLVYIGSVAYKYCGTMAEGTSITIKDGITEISSQCFEQCTSLSSIAIPSSVTVIGSRAFFNCNNLTSIDIPNSVNVIGSGAFSHCSGLTSISLPNKLVSIEGILGYCSNLEAVTIPSSVTSINTNAFNQCTSLSSIIIDAANTVYDSRKNCNAIIESNSNTLILGCNGSFIPEGVMIIGTAAFDNAVDIKEITIPYSVKEIGYQAFAFCNALTDVTVLNETPPVLNSSSFTVNNLTLHVPSGYKGVYKSTDGWKDFKEIVEIPAPSPVIIFADSNVKALCVENWDTNGDSELSEAEAAAVTDLGQVFKGNTQITAFDELQYFTGLTSIKESAFFGCSNLVSINLPDNITAISSEAFKGCISLKSVFVPNNVTIIGDYVFDSCSSLTSIEISNSVKEIGEQAFWDCTSLKSINLPEGLTKIAKNLLRGCSSLTTITIPSTVTTIKNGAFYDCSSLTNLEIPENVISIGDYAFFNCFGLTSVKIGDGVTTIGNRAFRVCKSMKTLTLGKSVEEIGAEAFIGSQSLTDVYCYAESVPVAPSAFDETLIKDVTLHVPNVSLDAYKTADYWKEFKFIVGLDDIVTESDYIYSVGLSIYQGYTANLEMKLANENTFTAYQFDLVLPEGIALATDENGKYLVSKSDRYSDNTQQVKVEKHDNNTYRIMSFSMQNGIINGNDGIILTITLKADEEITVGNANAEIRDIVLTLPDETKIKTKPITFPIGVNKRLKGDADGDGEIDVTDIVAMINYIMGQPSEKFVMPAADINDDGEVDIFDVMKAINLVMSQKKSARSMARASRSTEEHAYVKATDDGVAVGVNNPARFTAFQFDVEVTDGMELTDVRLTASLGNHKLYFIKNGQNTYRLIGVSMDNSTLTTNGNELVELSFSKGGHVQISDIIFITPQETKVHFVGSGMIVTGIDGIEYEQTENIFDLSGRKIDTDRNHLFKGIYIINNKKVVIK